MGQRTKALDILEKARDEHDLDGVRLRALQRQLGDEPRYQAVYRAFNREADRK